MSEDLGLPGLSPSGSTAPPDEMRALRHASRTLLTSDGARSSQAGRRAVPAELTATRGWLPAAAARGLALFFGVFTLVNVVGAARLATFDESLWWIDLRELPRPLALALLTVLAVALLAYAFAPRMRPWRRWATVGLCLAAAAMTGWNGVDFYLEWRAGRIDPGVPLPLSFLLCAAFVYLGWAAVRPPAPRRRRWATAAVLLAVALGCVLAMPLAQVFFFGKTDYRRPADIVVVFGAQVHQNGRPSTSLNDRVNTAVDLYKAGLVSRVFVSGGVGDSGYNEALVMSDMAVKAGVRRKDVVIDSNGVSTQATVDNTVPFFGEDGWRRVIAVSQFYHLPRIKLTYQRAGVDVLTVPAKRSLPIRENRYLVVREIPAFWMYYLRAVTG